MPESASAREKMVEVGHDFLVKNTSSSGQFRNGFIIDRGSRTRERTPFTVFPGQHGQPEGLPPALFSGVLVVVHSAFCGGEPRPATRERENQ
jgi:hypothetical protein